MVDPRCVNIDVTRDDLITEFGKETLRDRYILPGESGPQEAFARACAAFADDEAHAQRLYDYVSKQWFGFATPLLSNGGSHRGLPISCFLNNVPDSREGILNHYVENGWLSSVGGGIGAWWGAIRSNGQKTRYGSASSGLIPFVKPMDSVILAFSQGVTRRGSYAAYTSIDHPEVEEFIAMRRPTGGDPNRKTLNLHHGVMVSDKFMEIIERCMADRSANDDWPLIDPHTKQVTKTVSARALWRQILETRIETGEPYIVFSDAIDRAFPEEQKNLGLKCHHSNLCTEITLAAGEDIYGKKRTAVCCISSVNLATYEQWGGPPFNQFIEDLVRMLDNVLTTFIENAPPSLADAVYSAKRERSIGLGVMGFHSYLQKLRVPIDGERASFINETIFRKLKYTCDRVNIALARERGPCPDSVGGGDASKRFMHMLAIAPNATSSIICGQASPGIEPFRANAYTAKTLSGSGFIKNTVLQELLQRLGYDTDETWKSIVTHRGSVQHLGFLTDEEKAVFRTAMEIDQLALIKLAAQRTPYICQSSSTNLFFSAGSQISKVVQTHFAAWKLGLKSLYYCRSESVREAEQISEAVINPNAVPVNVTDITSITEEGCAACAS